jgi:hypothetical protein
VQPRPGPKQTRAPCCGATSRQALDAVRAKVCTEEPLHLVFVLQRAAPEFPAIHSWAAWHSAFARLPASQRAVAAMVGIEERCRPAAWHARAGLSLRSAAHPGLLSLLADSI